MTIGYAAGIALDLALDLNVVYCLVVMGLCAVLALVARWRPMVTWTACFAMAILGAAHHHQQMKMLDPNHIYNVSQSAAGMARVRGSIVTRPNLSERAAGLFRRWAYQPESTYFTLNVDEVDGGSGLRPATGRVAVHVNGNILDLSAGDSIQVLGRLAVPQPPANPGAFDWRAHQRRQGIWMDLYVEGAANIIRDGEGGASWLDSLKERAATALAGETAGGFAEEQGLLETMILGRRTAVDRELQEAFVRTGCAHLLAVSGSNVAILVLCAWRLSQFLGLSGRRSMLIAMAVILFYGLIVDPFPPVRRAVVMGLIASLAVWAGRPAWTMHALTLSALVLLILNPALLEDASFLLSYTCMIGLLVIYPAIMRAIENLRRRWDPTLELRQRIAASQPTTTMRRVMRFSGKFAISALAVSLATSVITLPVLAYYFGRVPIFGGLNTAIVLPLFTVIVVLGFVTIALGLVLPTLGTMLSTLLNYLTALLIAMVEWLDQVFGAILYLPPPTPITVTMYYGCLALAVACMAGRLRWRREFWLAPLVVVGAGFGFGRTSNLDHLRFTTFSVGRGLATVLELPDGGVLVYDAGSGSLQDAGVRTILPYLYQRSIRKVDAVFISHANLDHYSGVPGLLDAMTVQRVFTSTYANDEDVQPADEDGPWDVLTGELNRHGLEPRPLNRASPALRLGETRFEVLWPPADPPWDLSENDASLVIRVRHGDRQLLLCGDIEQRVQEWLMQNEDLRADVLLLPHHGSIRTCLPEFAERVGAVVEIVSNSASQGWQPRNGRAANSVPSYAEPSGTLSRLFHTGHHGAITVELAEDGVEVSTFRSGVHEQVAYR